jgi:hypothetical protein
MLYDPKDHYEPEETKQFFEENKKIFERLFRFKQWKLLKAFRKKESPRQDGESKLKSRALFMEWLHF